MSRLLRVHTDATEHVWYGVDGVRADRTDHSPEQFVRTRLFCDAEHVRVLGTAGNARLIVKMFETRLKAKLHQRIQVGSPIVCFRESRLHDPVFVLQQLWQPSQASLSPGCWHDLCNKDFPTYYLIASFQESGGRVTDTVRRVCEYHPAWPAATFPETHDVESICRLVCIIKDPRWYNHPERPNRANRLFAYLGLHPRNFEAMNGLVPPHMCPHCRNWERTELAIKAWRGGRGPGDTRKANNFLCRIQDKVGGAKGLLKATQSYVQLIRLSWLQAVASKGVENGVEVAAYEAHCRRTLKTTLTQ